MKNITLDTASFSEQFGLYDFFNVLLSGASFLCGCCAISRTFSAYIWTNISVPKGLAIVLMIYILGLLLQQAASYADDKIFKIYREANHKVLTGKVDKDYKCETNGKVFKNPLTLAQYRYSSEIFLKKHFREIKPELFENWIVNGYVFTMCQYFVAVYGKDRKVEKLRALYAMSRNFAVCFLLLASLSLLSVFTKAESVSICTMFGMSFPCTTCADKVLWAICFAGIGLLFLSHTKRLMRNFLLILLGTFNAIVCSEENEKDKVLHRGTKVKVKRKQKASL